MHSSTDKTGGARRSFLFAQACFIAYVVAEVIVAEIAHLRATENTSSIAMKGDTAVTANWPMTLVWAILVLLTYAIRKPIARGLFGLLATVYTISITLGNSIEVFARKQQFTGWKWTLVLSLDAIAAVFTVLCVLAGLNWARCALEARRADSTEAGSGTSLDPA